MFLWPNQYIFEIKVAFYPRHYVIYGKVIIALWHSFCVIKFEVRFIGQFGMQLNLMCFAQLLFIFELNGFCPSVI